MNNNLSNNNINVAPSLGTTLTSSGSAQGTVISTSGQQIVSSPMEIDKPMQTSMTPQSGLQSLTSSSPGLGNLQSVVGSGSTNIVTSAIPIASASTPHSSLATALQGSSSTATSSITNASTVGSMGSSMQSTSGSQGKSSSTATSSSATHEIPSVILTRPRLQDLVREVDPTEQLDEEVEELLLQLADDFVESTVSAACLLAKHRKAPTIEVKDIQLHLERNWNMWLPGFGTDELRPYKRAPVTEAHKQRLALIRKALKKY